MPRSLRSWFLAALAITAAGVVAASLWASADPDGLERIAQDLGFIDAAQGPGFEVLPDYTVPGLGGVASSVVAGLIGVAVVVVLMLIVGRLVARRRPKAPTS